MSVFCPILSFIAPYHNEKIKAYMFLRRSLASLARAAYKLHIYDFFFMSVHLGACPPPPPITKKLATLLLPAFAHQKSGQMKMADSVPPTRYTKSPPLVISLSKVCWVHTFTISLINVFCIIFFFLLRSYYNTISNSLQICVSDNRKKHFHFPVF